MSFYKNMPLKKEPVYLNQLKGDPDFLGFVETRDMVQRIVNDDTYTCGLYLHNGSTVGVKEDSSLWVYTEIVSVESLKPVCEWKELPYTIYVSLQTDVY